MSRANSAAYASSVIRKDIDRMAKMNCARAQSFRIHVSCLRSLPVVMKKSPLKRRYVPQMDVITKLGLSLQRCSCLCGVMCLSTFLDLRRML